MSLTLIRRGSIVLVSLDPAIGSEAAKTRPAVVVSNNTATATALRSEAGVVTVVPITSSISRVFPFQVLLPASETGLDHDSKAQAEQVRSVSVRRLLQPVGWIGEERMAEVDEALRLHLGL